MKRTIIAAFSLLASTTAGCAFDRVDLEDTGQVRVEPVAHEGFTLSAPSVWGEGEGATVYGSWRERNGQNHSFSPGHVHLILRSADGEELDTRQVPIQVTKTGSRNFRQNYLSYRTSFDSVPPFGSVLQVWHCHEDHQGEASVAARNS
jgi:hypothetical protein